MNTPSEPARNSFFDDDDLNIIFEFQKCDKLPQKDYLNITAQQQHQQQQLQCSLFYKVTGNIAYQQDYFGIIRRYIIKYKDNTFKQIESVLEYSNARLGKIQGANGQYQHGITLQKNANTCEFYSNVDKIIESWFQKLRQYCILTNFHDNYKAIKMIGKGSFAKVYLVENKQNGKSFAVKSFTKENVIISNKANAKPSMINEIDIMRAITHENIIQLYDVYETEKSIYLVLELIQGKSLQDILKKPNFREEYSQVKIINMIKMILEALSYLALNRIMHRDLKPDNILLDKSDKIKIVDFGLATFIDANEYIFKKCGTPGYIAPEVFKYDIKNPTTAYGDKCDVFSAGCILYYMLFGKPFFDGGNASEILMLNRKFTIEFQALATIKDELKNPNSKINKDGLTLLSNLIEFDHKIRISAAQALQMSFFIPIPQGMYKNYITGEMIADPLTRSKDSQLFNDRDLFKIINSQPQDNSPDGSKYAELRSPLKLSSTSKGNKDKYAEKDSLYLDVGPAVINGRIDTITQNMGSANNSLLFSQMIGGSNANVNSNSSSLSHFAKATSADKKAKLGLKHSSSGGNSFLKAAIIRNMQKNNENAEEYKESLSPGLKRRLDSYDRRGSELGLAISEMKENGIGEEYSNENGQLNNNGESIKT